MLSITPTFWIQGYGARHHWVNRICAQVVQLTWHPIKDVLAPCAATFPLASVWQEKSASTCHMIKTAPMARVKTIHKTFERFIFSPACKSLVSIGPATSADVRHTSICCLGQRGPAYVRKARFFPINATTRPDSPPADRAPLSAEFLAVLAGNAIHTHDEYRRRPRSASLPASC